MKDRKIAILLIGFSIILSIGAYFLVQKPAPENSTHRAEVVSPAPEAPKAPEWVNGKPESKPDYSASEASPQEVTPVPAEVANEEPQTVEITEDKLVSFTFVESFADFLLHRFQPQNAKGKPASLASAMGLNKYFGRELDGFNVSGNDIRESRKAIFDYAFNPTMLDTLYSLYAEPLMVHLVDTAANVEREYTVGTEKELRVLTNDEIGVMLRLNARRIERTADLFRSFGNDPAIIDMAARYRRSAKAVERANEQLQNDIADDKPTAKASDRLKQAILQRERHKAEIITTLKQVCHACTDGELFYMSQWAYRRTLGEAKDKSETFQKIAEILDDLSIRFQDKAAEYK